MNTGSDGIGPDGAGVPHYRDCNENDEASDRSWPDGTPVTVIKVGTLYDCDSWLLVAADGQRLWVREEFVFARATDHRTNQLYLDAANRTRKFEESELVAAVFTDKYGNLEWLFVELIDLSTLEKYYYLQAIEHYVGKGGIPPRGLLVFVPDDYPLFFLGGEFGFTIALANPQRLVEDIFDLAPEQDALVMGSVTSISEFWLMVVRSGWFAERDIEAGTFVGVYHLPVRVSPEGVPQ